MLINVHEKLNYLINNSAEKVKFLSDINNFIISKGNATLENECLIIPDITIGTGASSVIFQTSKSFETDDKKHSRCMAHLIQMAQRELYLFKSHMIMDQVGATF